MPSRESLRELIDTLPEGALESAEQVLRNYQIWPPKPPIEVEEMRERVDQLFKKNIEQQIARTGRGVMGSHSMSSRLKPDGDGGASMSTSEGQTSVTFELRIFRGHRLEIEEPSTHCQARYPSLLLLRIRGQESVWPAPWQHARDQNIRVGTQSFRPRHVGTPHNPVDRYVPWA